MTLHKRLTVIQDKITQENLEASQRRKFLARLKDSIIYYNENHRYVADNRGLDYVLESYTSLTGLFELTYSRKMHSMMTERNIFYDLLKKEPSWVGATFLMPE